MAEIDDALKYCESEMQGYRRANLQLIEDAKEISARVTATNNYLSERATVDEKMIYGLGGEQVEVKRRLDALESISPAEIYKMDKSNLYLIRVPSSVKPDDMSALSDEMQKAGIQCIIVSLDAISVVHLGSLVDISQFNGIIPI